MKSTENTSFYIHTFLKIFEEESHADNFLDGKMRFSPLSFFKKYDRNEATSCGRMDDMEGVVASIPPKDISCLKIAGISIDKKILADNVVVTCPDLDNVYIMSTYCISTYGKQGKSYSSLEEAEKDILDIDCLCDGELGIHAVIITKPLAFKERIKKALIDAEISHCYAHGIVEYYDRKKETKHFNNNFFEPVFKKDEKYSYQREYRFSFDPTTNFVHTQKNEPYFLEIGDINDIAIKTTLRCLRENMKFLPKR